MEIRIFDDYKTWRWLEQRLFHCIGWTVYFDEIGQWRWKDKEGRQLGFKSHENRNWEHPHPCYDLNDAFSAVESLGKNWYYITEHLVGNYEYKVTIKHYDDRPVCIAKGIGEDNSFPVAITKAMLDAFGQHVW
jgi:hypothetical protein